MRVSRSAVEVSKKASVGEMDHGVEPLQPAGRLSAFFFFHSSPSGYRYPKQFVICLSTPSRLSVSSLDSQLGRDSEVWMCVIDVLATSTPPARRTVAKLATRERSWKLEGRGRACTSTSKHR